MPLTLLQNITEPQALLDLVVKHVRERNYKHDPELSRELDDLQRTLAGREYALPMLAHTLIRIHDWILVDFQRPPFFDRAADSHSWEQLMSQTADEHELTFAKLDESAMQALLAAQPEPLSREAQARLLADQPS